MKVCKGPCGLAKPLDAFHRHPQTKSGRYPTCAECRNAKARAKRLAAGAKPRLATVIVANHPLTRDAWFAGFTDGEGCFLLGPNRGGVVPRFFLGLRADDMPVLAELRSAFGGVLGWTECPGPSTVDGKPRCTLQIGRKTELVRLVAYFDRFPLRSKKARDYTIWREAVLIYIAHDRNHPDLPILARALTEVREYDPAIPRQLAIA